MNSLHDLEISLVYCNDITKKTCLIPVLDQNLFIFPPKIKHRAFRYVWFWKSVLGVISL